MAPIALAAAGDSAAALIVGLTAGGAGFGLAFSRLPARALSPIPPAHRAGVMSAFFIAAYAALAIRAVLAGFAAGQLGLDSTFEILESAVAALALVVVVQAWRTRPRPVASTSRLATDVHAAGLGGRSKGLAPRVQRLRG